VEPGEVRQHPRSPTSAPDLPPLSQKDSVVSRTPTSPAIYKGPANRGKLMSQEPTSGGTRSLRLCTFCDSPVVAPKAGDGRGETCRGSGVLCA